MEAAYHEVPDRHPRWRRGAAGKGRIVTDAHNRHFVATTEPLVGSMKTSA